MIEVRGLTKYYGDHAAIRDLDFDIQKGEVIGFLGLNGAGKSTTLRVLSCVLLPTSGQVTVEGVDIVQHAHDVRAKIGFLPDAPPLYNEMTVGGYLRFAARLRGVSARDADHRVTEAEEKTALLDVHDAPIATLSHGYRQRVGVAQALVHRPSLLILDEPTSGLDPVQIVEMRGLIRALRGAHTVLISSHFLAEISQTCDRLLVIQSGQIVARGTEDELARAMGGAGAIDLTVRTGHEGGRVRDVLVNVPHVTGVQILGENGGDLRLRIEAGEDVRPDVVRALVSAGIDVLRVDRAASRLESVFIRLANADGNPTEGKLS